jgi:hypothetical protein
MAGSDGGNLSNKKDTINHDRLFKELLTIFFREFIELFLPQVAAYTDFSSLTALDLDFNFTVIQLNQLDWHDFLNKPNPVASALMAKMKIAPKDRVRVKLECLRMLTGLELNPAQTQVVYGFVNTYLQLDAIQKQEFEVEVSKLTSEVEKEQIMQVINEWTAAGIEQGIEQGELKLVLRQLQRKLGPLSPALEQQVGQLNLAGLERLGEALLDFSNQADLVAWLATPPAN